MFQFKYRYIKIIGADKMVCTMYIFITPVEYVKKIHGVPNNERK